MPEISGAQWCARYPTSTALVDLIEPFRSNLVAFVDSMRAGGASVAFNATYRPQERAYLMHWCCMIGNGGHDPTAVSPLAGVDIDWTHGGDQAAAKVGAQAMMQGYDIAFPAALVSRHTQRRAVDMTIRFSGAIQVKNKSGLVCVVAAQIDLVPIGATFGVIKLASDPPHWSDDGH